MTALLRRWADDLFLHGHDLTRWITDYVDIEESMAVGSMSQEELAHGATLLEFAGDDPDHQEREELAHGLNGSNLPSQLKPFAGNSLSNLPLRTMT